MGRLFGTDGARGIANSELTCELAMNIGRAAAMVLTDSDHRHPKILIGKDTRLSSDMLENALTAGLCRAPDTGTSVRSRVSRFLLPPISFAQQSIIQKKHHFRKTSPGKNHHKNPIEPCKREPQRFFTMKISTAKPAPTRCAGSARPSCASRESCRTSPP